ncbi:MAG: signal peptidase I [Candidatus Eisenbacteria bacterium]|nr:signal peptidase I [Candidatus Eisenbacteria bacterium]
MSGKGSGRKRSVVQEYVEAALWALVLTLFLRAFVIQAFRIPSESMLNTLLVGDFLFVNKFEYGPKLPFTQVRLPGLRPPHRGDVIVFQYPQDPSKDFIKRCIGVGGDTLEVVASRVIVNGDTLREPYAVNEHRPFHKEQERIVIPPGQLFMMGDNRDNSNDSRYWGTVPMDYVKGRAMFIYWSWDGQRFRPRWSRLLRVIH